MAKFGPGLPSIRAWTQGFYGSPYDEPLGRLREAIEIIRLVIEKGHTGELTSFEGRYHQHDWSELLASGMSAGAGSDALRAVGIARGVTLYCIDADALVECVAGCT